MGLDMYAYKVRADLIGDKQVDINVYESAAEKFGYSPLTPEQYEALDEASKNRSEELRRKALNAAEESGALDTDFAYWRKFNSLHGWMENLYRRKGGTSPDFNCDTVRLMPEDLDALFVDAENKRLEPTAGFFFGPQGDFNDDDRAEVLEFVGKARAAIAQGYAVVYSSWW